MSTIRNDMKQKDSFFTDSLPSSAPYSSSSPKSYENESTTSPEASRISPVIILILVIVGIVFLVSGVVHLLISYFKNRPSPSENHQSNRFPETPLHRQLQQLFMLHDSGLDQASIDALPMFFYKDIVGLTEPFDCAVCLCEFSEHDKLRLLPSCSHAFHITCIETWLLSNSTCPLCRDTLLSSGNPMENPVSSFEVLREMSNGFTSDDDENVQESAAPKRVFSVRLGKFKSMNGGDNREREQGEMSSGSINLDTRRCYSMGAFQYVLVESDLQIALSHHNACDDDDDDGIGSNGELEGKKISRRTRGESYSVSKTWLWSKKNKLPISSSSNVHMAELGLASSLSYYKFPNELLDS